MTFLAAGALAGPAHAEPPAPAVPSSAEIREAVDGLSSDSFKVREGAMARLAGWAGSHPEALEKALPADPDDPAVRACCDALRERIRFANDPLLRRALAASGKDEALRKAVEALARAPSRGAIDDLAARVMQQGLERDPFIDLIARQIESPDRTVRRTAAAKLGHFPYREDLGTRLLTLLEAEPDQGVRIAVISTLGRWRHLPAAEALVGRLKGDSNLVREAAVDALKDLKDPGIAGPLFGILVEGGHVASQARAVLVGMKSAAVPFVASRLDDPDAATRQAAYGVLREIVGGWPRTSDEAAIGKARAWWDRHKDDPCYTPVR